MGAETTVTVTVPVQSTTFLSVPASISAPLTVKSIVSALSTTETKIPAPAPVLASILSSPGLDISLVSTEIEKDKIHSDKGIKYFCFFKYFIYSFIRF